MIRPAPALAAVLLAAPVLLAATVLLAAGALLTAAPAATAYEAPADDADGAPRWYTFGWPVTDDPDRTPRGGTSEGPGVTPAPEPSAEWRALQDPELTDRERDRRAILALAGEYRTSFDFIETLTYVPGLERARPYQSWATELVFVLESREDFVSLQHLLVMSFVRDGEVRGPFVQKHWRQDWRYEADRRLAFLGDDEWRVEAVAPESGTWTQTVHQVDDTPRYAATGRWVHRGDASWWEAERAWRPLPRREHTVRDDYDVMAGTHRLTITPAGWTHEQDNLKARIDAAGTLAADTPYVAREQGLARYTRLQDFDFSAGRDYWADTEAYWADVRAWWRARLAETGGFELRDRVDDVPLFVPLFDGARRITDGDGFEDAEARRAYVDETLRRYVRRP